MNYSELLRYQRHFPVIGFDGQQKLRQASVLCVGAGGLGCPALQYLTAAGVGRMGIVDGDRVELSNLHRQILFYEEDIGKNKAKVIGERLGLMNPHVSFELYPEFLSEYFENIISSYDVVMDATDNYPARYQLNALCRKLKKPLVSASIYQFEAQISVFNYLNGPCYQCLYPEPPPANLIPDCEIGGVLGVLPGVVGTIQATEAVKIILGIGDILSGTMLLLNLLTMRFDCFEMIKQNCHLHPVIKFDTHCSRDEDKVPTITAKELSLLLAEDQHTLQLVDVREPYERAICHIGGIHLPLSQFEGSMHQFIQDKPIVVYCKRGNRSLAACRLLSAAGFQQVCSLEKGIMSWIDTVDSSLMRY